MTIIAVVLDQPLEDHVNWEDALQLQLCSTLIPCSYSFESTIFNFSKKNNFT